MDKGDPATKDFTFAVSISTDRDQFLRRTCPSCGRDFKTRVDPIDLQWALTSYCRHAGADVGPEDEQKPIPARIRCPYCTHEDKGSEMLTEETTTYLKRIVYREWVVPQMNKWFSDLADSLGSTRRSGGLFSLSVEVSRSGSVLPVRNLSTTLRHPAKEISVVFLRSQEAQQSLEGTRGLCPCDPRICRASCHPM